MTHLGEIAAASCAVFWALCSLAFAGAGRRVGATAVNQIRVWIAVVALGVIHWLVLGSVVPAAMSVRQATVLAVSGLAGLAIGDLCLFRCMAILGPRLGTLLMAASPVLTALIARVTFGERLGSLGVLGMLVAIGGVAMVLLDRAGREGWRPPAGLGPRARAVAVGLGLFAALGQAVGLVLTKDGMAATTPAESELDPLSATLVRMVAAGVALAALVVAGGKGAVTRRAFGDGRALRLILIGALFGPILGVWASSVAVRHADAGVAATLMSLAPVLMVPIARVAYGARPGPLGIVGTLVAVAGGAMLFLRDGG